MLVNCMTVYGREDIGVTLKAAVESIYGMRWNGAATSC